MFFDAIKSLLSLLSAVADMFRQRQMLDAGRAIEEAKDATTELDAVTRGTAARDATAHADRNVDTTDGLPDDGFRRD